MSRILRSLRAAMTIVTTITTIRISKRPSKAKKTSSDETEKKKEDLFEDEPKMECLTCGDRIPVHDLQHTRKCRKDPKNYVCPYCGHSRTPKKFESHILSCGSRMPSPLEIENWNYAHRSCERKFERMLEVYKNRVKDNYIHTLLTTIFPACMCSGCLSDSRRAIEWDAFLKAEKDFKDAAQSAILDIFIPIYNSSLMTIQCASERKTIDRFMKMRGHRAIAVLKRMLDRDFVESSRKIEILRADKIRDMEIIQERVKNRLFKELIDFRTYFWAVAPPSILDQVVGMILEIEADIDL